MKNNTKQTLQIYWHSTKGYRAWLFFIFLSVIGASATSVVIPLYFKKFFDLLASPEKQNTQIVSALTGIILVLAILELARWLFWRVAFLFNNRCQTTIIANLTNKCFRYLHKHSFSFFNNNFVGSLVKRVNWFTRAFESVVDKIIWSMLPLLVELTLVTAILMQKSILLGMAIIIWLIIFLITNWFLTSYKMRFDIERSEAESKSTAILADTITNNNNVKLFNGYHREMATFGAAVNLVRKLRKFTWDLDSIFEGVQGLFFIILEVAIFYTAVYLWRANKLTVGDFVLLQSFIIIIFEKVWGFGRIIRQLYADLADAEEMTIIFNTPHEIQDAAGATRLAVAAGKIEFSEVIFNYHATRKIIENLNFIIQPREKIALVGPSGAGKTTIIKLLLRMHDITGGKIIIDEQKINHVTQSSLWDAISMVPQDPILFHRTLLENIRYGKPDASDAEVIAAAKLAHCHEFILEFPDRYQTYVGERGVKLSGGERQRVAIARAILRDAPILVLDEATSSLDSESEHLIQDALSNLMRDKTVIVIAHRLSTIMKVDRILVVNHGQIVEEGTHNKLLQKTNGIYRQLWKRQAGGFIQDEGPSSPRDDQPDYVETIND